MATIKRNVLEEIATKVVTMMETSGSNWAKPWAGMVSENGAPRSAVGRRYTGINSMNLAFEMMDHGWDQPIFATFKQWQDKGAKVLKGSKGVPVVFFKKIEVEDRDLNDGSTKTIPMLKHFTVFNIDQVEGADGLRINPVDLPNDQAWMDELTAEEVIEASGADIEHKAGDRAFFAPSQDRIVLPLKAQFSSADGYYGTALHELTHWTGHESRLDRQFGKRFGDQAYAFEELVAEMGAAMLCGATGVTSEPREDHAKYLSSWIKHIKDDPKKLMTACSMAEKAATFLLEKAGKIESISEAA